MNDFVKKSAFSRFFIKTCFSMLLGLTACIFSLYAYTLLAGETNSTGITIFACLSFAMVLSARNALLAIISPVAVRARSRR